MLDATLTDIQFSDDFVNKQSDWMQTSRPAEPDLKIDGLHQSLLSRFLALLGLA